MHDVVDYIHCWDVIYCLDTPEWKDMIMNNAQDYINVTCDRYVYKSMSDVVFLLNISWPDINNAEDMDFDSFRLWIETTLENCFTHMYTDTGETTALFYEYTLRVPKFANDLELRIAIEAVNKCNDIGTLQANYSVHTGMITL